MGDINQILNIPWLGIKITNYTGVRMLIVLNQKVKQKKCCQKKSFVICHMWLQAGKSSKFGKNLLSPKHFVYFKGFIP